MIQEFQSKLANHWQSQFRPAVTSQLAGGR